MSEISGLASDILQSEFDGDTGLAPESYIEAWLETNLGQLNTLLNTQYSGINPGFDLESRAIYTQLYLSEYYRKQARNALKGLISSSTGSDILSIKDGNSSVSFTNKNEVAKVYKNMADEANTRIEKLVAQYNMYQAEPLQLGGIESTTVSI